MHFLLMNNDCVSTVKTFQSIGNSVHRRTSFRRRSFLRSCKQSSEWQNKDLSYIIRDNTQPDGCASRQVAIRLGDSSDSSVGPSKKRPRDEETKSRNKKKKQQTVASSQSTFKKKCSPTSIIEIMEAGISDEKKVGLGWARLCVGFKE
ncbi:unnamed protein product [Linum trigynum]|uniref:Uncharacterized protein n=1 Tax=Linum trigynum TaxID=586398 RepID=A0AAV2EYR3_9ROSI